jgi:hypothetical protein
MLSVHLVTWTERSRTFLFRHIPALAPPGILLLCPGSPAGLVHDVPARHALLPGKEGTDREGSQIYGLAKRNIFGSCEVFMITSRISANAKIEGKR